MTLVLPDNRAYVARLLNSDSLQSAYTLARGPNKDVIPNKTMRSYVMAKIKQQDNVLRERLGTLRYKIDAPDTIRLLCGSAPIEAVITSVDFYAIDF